MNTGLTRSYTLNKQHLLIFSEPVVIKEFHPIEVEKRLRRCCAADNQLTAFALVTNIFHWGEVENIYN